MTTLRSGKVIDPSMDELSGLFGKSMKFTTPKTKKPQPSEDDMFSRMFGKLTIGKSTIGKSRSRRRGRTLTHKKKHKTSRNTPKTKKMDLMGGKKRRSRMIKRRI